MDMAVVGSVVDTEVVVTLTEKSFSLAFPEPNLTVVGVVHNAQYVKVVLDASRNAILPAAGGLPTAGDITATVGTMRRVTWTITGTNLNYAVLTKGTSTTVCFYYGTAIAGSPPLTQFAGIVATSTLSSGSGTATFTFPSGKLTMTGFTAGSTITAVSTVLQATWATESGKTFNAYVPMGLLTQSSTNDDIIQLELPVSITVAVTLSLGTGSDVVYIYAFYK